MGLAHFAKPHHAAPPRKAHNCEHEQSIASHCFELAKTSMQPFKQSFTETHLILVCLAITQASLVRFKAHEHTSVITSVHAYAVCLHSLGLLCLHFALLSI